MVQMQAEAVVGAARNKRNKAANSNPIFFIFLLLSMEFKRNAVIPPLVFDETLQILFRVDWYRFEESYRV